MKSITIKEAFLIPFFLLAAIWIAYFMQLTGLGHYECYGIQPREKEGIRGIFLSPLFHNTKDWQHIINNSIPLAILSFFTFAIYKKIAYWIVILGWVLTGLLVWLFADIPILGKYQPGCHIGASGIVYLLASFLFFSGLFRKSINTIAVALIVAFLYGSMIWGIFPQEILGNTWQNQRISWESHLMGFLVGIFLAFTFRKYGPRKKTYLWQSKNISNLDDEALWQRYLDSLPEGEKPKTYEEIISESKKQKKTWEDLL